MGHSVPMQEMRSIAFVVYSPGGVTLIGSQEDVIRLWNAIPWLVYEVHQPVLAFFTLMSSSDEPMWLPSGEYATEATRS